ARVRQTESRRNLEFKWRRGKPISIGNLRLIAERLEADGALFKWAGGNYHVRRKDGSGQEQTAEPTSQEAATHAALLDGENQPVLLSYGRQPRRAKRGVEMLKLSRRPRGSAWVNTPPRGWPLTAKLHALRAISTLRSS